MTNRIGTLALTVLSILAIVALAGGFYTTIVEAQGAPLSCTISPTAVGVNQTATARATGGTGSYTWSGSNINISNPNSPTLLVTFPSIGTYLLQVASGSQTATCTLTVTTDGSTGGGGLTCLPHTQTVRPGQTAFFTATGGTGSYTWSGTNLNVTNPTGAGFQATYPGVGTQVITVRSGSSTSNCTLNLVSVGTGGTPGFPNTGGGGARF